MAVLQSGKQRSDSTYAYYSVGAADVRHTLPHFHIELSMGLGLQAASNFSSILRLNSSGMECNNQKWLHNPCLRGVPRAGRSGYITPAFSGSPKWGIIKVTT